MTGVPVNWRTGSLTSDGRSMSVLESEAPQAMVHTVSVGNGSVTVSSNISIKCCFLKEAPLVSPTNLNLVRANIQ